MIDLNKQPDERIMPPVSGDEVGIPDHVDPERSGTLGLQRVVMLGGEFHIQRSRPGSFTLSFPVRG